MLTDAEITELLRSNERRRSMTDDERDRVRAALGLNDASASDRARVTDAMTEPPAAELIDLSVRPVTSVTAKREGKAAWLAAAAVLIAGIALTYRGTQPDGSVDIVSTDLGLQIEPTPAVPTPVPAPTVTAAGQAFCTGPFTDFVEAMVAWRGVDGWSRLTDERNPEPHLPALASRTLEALAPLVDTKAVLAESQALTAALEPLIGEGSQIRDQRTQAMLGTVSFIVDSIEADLATASTHFLNCDLDRLALASAPTGG